MAIGMSMGGSRPRFRYMGGLFEGSRIDGLEYIMVFAVRVEVFTLRDERKQETYISLSASTLSNIPSCESHHVSQISLEYKPHYSHIHH